MRAQRRKQTVPFWPSVMMRKWLNIKPKLNDFSEDELDTENEDNDGNNSGNDNFFEVYDNQRVISKSSGEKTIPPLQRLERGKSESLRVSYVSNKDVRFGFYGFICNIQLFFFLSRYLVFLDNRVIATRVMIGTWNVAGQIPNEDLDLDQWLRTQEPADIYVLGFQEVVPLNAGNVLGAEDSRPIRTWEAIIRRTLNKFQQSKTICKSYSAPLSPLLEPVASGNGHEYSKLEPEDKVNRNLNKFKDRQMSVTELNYNWMDRTSSFDWPEHPLDAPPKVSVPGIRRVMSFGLCSTNFVECPQSHEPQDVALHLGLKRQYHSLGNLGILWSERQDKFDILNTLDCTSEGESPSVTVEECANLGEREFSEPCANYVRVVGKQMVGIYVSVWVSRKLRRHVNNLEVASIGVGLLGYMGNKGSISISMSLFQTRLCFVCSHLASGHKSGDQQKRNSDVDEILRRTRFSSLFPAGQPLMIPSHDRVFWFGDLNYRIDLPDGEVRHLVAMKRWDDLLMYDQLTKELISGSTFVGWNEGSINFPPTYKYERNSNRYAGEVPKEAEKKRSPAWCDRILWLGKGTKQLSYWSSPDLRLSDHRPVSSFFLVEVEVFDQRRLERVLNFTNPGFVSKEQRYMTVGF